MDKLERAQRAEQLMSDPLITEFFEKYDLYLYQRWKMSKDLGERETCHQLGLAADAFRVQMKSFMADGRMEEENG